MTGKLALAAAALMALSACTNNTFGRAASDAAANAGAGGIGSGALGNISETSLEYFQSAIGDTVRFPVDQATLTPEAIAILDAQANWLTVNGDKTAVIEGHADEQGTREYNLALGARRAAAVFNYLSSRGVADSRLQTVTFGKERPLEVCSNESCWSKNRRAQTVVRGGGLGS